MPCKAAIQLDDDGVALTANTYKEACCKGIFAPAPRPSREDATVANQFAYMKNFMTIGCMCIDDIYEQDTKFFDDIYKFVGKSSNPCAAQSGASTGDLSKTLMKSSQTKHLTTSNCPTTMPINGFLDGSGNALSKDDMMEKVLNLAVKTPPAPPPLPTAVAMDEIVAELHLRNFNADKLDTVAKETALGNAIEQEIAAATVALNAADSTTYPTPVAASAIEVTIVYFSRGGAVSRRLLAASVATTSSDENTIVTISIRQTATGVFLTPAQVKIIRAVLVKWSNKGLNMATAYSGVIYGNVTVSSTVTSKVTVPALPTDTVTGAVVGAPPSTLPAAATGLPRQGVDGATYEGGFEITNTDYLVSLIGQAVPGFAMAIIFLVLMVLMLVVYIASTICGALCCKCCNGAYKPRKFTKKDLVINKVMILVFVAMTAAGCFMIFSEAPKLLDSVSDLTQAMVDTVLDLVDDGSSISAALRAASVDDSMGLNSMEGTLDSMDDAMDTVEDVINKAQDQIDEQLEAAGGLILAGAGGLFAVTFLVFAAAFIGWWRILILFIVILSLGMVLAWIVWGVIAMLTVLLDDLCWAMQDYLDNPGSSDLGDLIPCMDTATALETMTLARSMSVMGIVGVNAFLEDYAGANPYQNYMCYQYVKIRLEDLCSTTEANLYFDDPVTKFVCADYHLAPAYPAATNGLADLDKEFDGKAYVWADAKCPFPTEYYKVALGDFGNDPNDPTNPGVNNLKCPFIGFERTSPTNDAPNTDKPIPFAMGQCYAARQIPRDMFAQSEKSATLAQGILDIIPTVEGLLQCEFVETAFTRMVGPCDDMNEALQNLYAGFLLVALGYFLTWVSTLVVVSRLQYYKTGCTDAGERYK
mmetsp:Transcript_2908/g.10190  ORF Transcript_2908/g.10190 Transcript_2908/m.10190 type:complete len:870 (-) Transcript_2908:746-3355(-)